MSLTDSILQTASMARWVSVAVTATDQTIFALSVQVRTLMQLLRPSFITELFLQFGESGGGFLNIRREVSKLLDLAKFYYFIVRSGTTRCPFDRLFFRLHLDHPVTADDFLHLGEGAVGHFGFAS